MFDDMTPENGYTHDAQYSQERSEVHRETLSADEAYRHVPPPPAQILEGLHPLDAWSSDSNPQELHNMPPQPSRSSRRARRMEEQRKKKGATRLIVTLIVVALVVIGGYFAVSAVRTAFRGAQIGTAKNSDTADYPGPGEDEVEFTIEDGEGSDQIGANLVKAEIVKSAGAFRNAVIAANAGTKLQSGTFTLRKHMKAADVVTIITDTTKITGSLIVRPGEKVSAIIARAVELTSFTQDDFDTIISNRGVGILPDEAFGSFEGWFEPGTYNVKGMSSTTEILTTMVKARIAKLDKLGVAAADREDVLKKASIAEAEVNSQQYYAKVARVIENRLATNMSLGMDTAVAYGLGINARNLTDAQLADTSNAYNLRVHKGLPPTPINNPGDNAISAVLKPEAGDWLYFVTVNLNTGETKFTADHAEFEKFAAEYRAWEAAN